LSIAAAMACVKIGAAQAQDGRFGSRPTTSPYLGLARGGNQALNYHRSIRPELEFRNQDSRFGSLLSRQDRAHMRELRRLSFVERMILQNSPDRLREHKLPVLPETGHTAGFMNYSQYFMSFDWTRR
jgi:hypothetical protein